MPQRAAVLAFGVSVEQMSSGRLAADQTPFAPQALIESVQLMRMRQSIAQLERAFVEEVALDRTRREKLSETAEKRTRRRAIHKTHQNGSLRFVALIFAIIATAVIVTITMFEVLFLVLG